MEFLLPLGISQTELAKHIKCNVKVINRLINEHAALTAEMAIKLAATFNTTAEFWLNAQKAVDLYKANLGLKNIALPKCINKKTKEKLEGSKVA